MIQLQATEVLWSEVSLSCPICPCIGDVPQSLPSFLLTTCGDPDSWIYSDQKCDGVNNCGDCSDELSPGGGLATGGQQPRAWSPACCPCILGRKFPLLLEHVWLEVLAVRGSSVEDAIFRALTGH